ncbi:ATP-dependent DNA helicase DinG [Bacillus niameyensis]|uniref:ATP-dependent DNA helicase DinG n=1 Tax=Bacillus niameyensis TaxID=1522308 RepID=UPI000780638A|nr:ATP-dependent DNA helicase DinG [Bacillus niameyensis]
MLQKYVVVDLETTGNTQGQGDRIIQISAVVIENLKIIDQYTSFINPEVPIPPFIEELTGINDDMVKNAPLFAEIAHDIHNFLSNSVFVAHNVSFDLKFLQKEFQESGFDHVFSETVDTVELAKILMPEAPSYKLSELSGQLDFEHDHPHQADSDALATAELLLMLIDKTKQLPIVTLEKLVELAFFLKSDIGTLFQTVLAEQQKKLGNLPSHLEVFRGIAIKRKVIKEKDKYVIDYDFPKTPEQKSQLLKGFKKRESQFDMMDTIYHSLIEKKHAVIEAGTGTGKSIAYLLPAAYFALGHHNPVVISTYTNQMQEQILNNELNKLSKLISFPIQATILKGRNHYINLFKFEQTLKEQENHYDTVLTKMQLLVWLVYTDTGDLDELNFSGGGLLFKQRIKHDGWFINKEKDPWLSRDFYLFARKLAACSDLIITNHSMLLADTEKNMEILPEYHYIIVDEAHHLERAARKSFGKKLEYTLMKYWLGRVGSLEKGLLFSKLEFLINKKKLVPAILSEKIEQAIINLDDEIDDLYTQLSRQLLISTKDKLEKMKRETMRITEAVTAKSNWLSIIVCAERVYDFHQLIKRGIEERLSLLKQKASELSTEEQAFLEEANSFILDWTSIGTNVKDLLIRPSETDIIWLEGDIRILPNGLTIKQEPRHIGSLLFEHLYNKKTVIMTSATLTVNHSFRYFLNEMGIPENNVVQKIYKSPFEYKKMAKLMIPTDIPDIRGKVTDDYIEAIAGHIIAISEATNGRLLTLFTSYDMLTKTYHLIKESGSLEDFVILAQGITVGSRTRLTKSFQQFNKAILFGTSSFWEGVDIPGKDLSCLIIVRLPFSPPKEPVTEAKYEEVKRQGLNPFTESALPEAVLRFKQGFGRLIRGESDRGVVIVFDRRLDTTSYGNVFLESLPNISVKRGSLNEIINDIEDWL